MKRALAFGTQDARLFLHAGLIAEEEGSPTKSIQWFDKADNLRQMLFPSEVHLLQSARERLQEHSD